MFDIDMNGKVAVVTGGGRGMANKCAEYFAQAGAAVSIWDIDQASAEAAAAKFADKYGVKTMACAVNVADEKQCFDAADRVVSEWGKIDSLVHVAGIGHGSLSVMDPSVEEIRKLFDINVFGAINVNRAVLRYMLPANYGHIVNMGSLSAKINSSRMMYYGMSKTAVVSMTKGLAEECGCHDITVNAVCPGVVHTRLWDEVIEKNPENREVMEGATMLMPMGPGRMQEPEDIAAMVLFLASDLAKNITGQAINVDGGAAQY